MTEPAAERGEKTILLLIDAKGRFVGFAVQGGLLPPDDLELVEWPVRPPTMTSCSVGGLEYAWDVIASESAELGKLGSMDVLLQIAFYAAARDGWECYSVLPGQFGQQVYPPCVTMLFKRKAT